MLLENGLWRLRVYRLRLRSQSGWGLEQNDTLKMQLLREQKFKRSFETEQHDTSAFWDTVSFKKTHHWTRAAVARCHVLRQESYWEAPGLPKLNTIMSVSTESPTPNPEWSNFYWPQIFSSWKNCAHTASHTKLPVAGDFGPQKLWKIDDTPKE